LPINLAAKNDAGAAGVPGRPRPYPGPSANSPPELKKTGPDAGPGRAGKNNRPRAKKTGGEEKAADGEKKQAPNG
jgi:hypothetical protein